MKRLVLAAVTAVGMTACGGPGSFSGTVKGDKLTVKDSASFKVSADLGTISIPIPFVVLSDQPNLCDNIKKSITVKGSSSFGFALGATDGDGKLTAATSTGDYAVNSAVLVGAVIPGGNPTKNALASLAIFDKLDDKCVSTFISTDGDNLGAYGNVKLTTLKQQAGGSMAGSFDVNFNSGDHVTGSFDAPFCDAPVSVNLTSSLQPSVGGNPVCQ